MKRILSLIFLLSLALPAFAQPDSTASVPQKEFHISATAWSRGEVREGALSYDSGE